MMMMRPIKTHTHTLTQIGEKSSSSSSLSTSTSACWCTEGQKDASRTTHRVSALAGWLQLHFKPSFKQTPCMCGRGTTQTHQTPPLQQHSTEPTKNSARPSVLTCLDDAPSKKRFALTCLERSGQTLVTTNRPNGTDGRWRGRQNILAAFKGRPSSERSTSCYMLCVGVCVCVYFLWWFLVVYSSSMSYPSQRGEVMCLCGCF